VAQLNTIFSDPPHASPPQIKVVLLATTQEVGREVLVRLLCWVCARPRGRQGPHRPRRAQMGYVLEALRPQS